MKQWSAIVIFLFTTACSSPTELYELPANTEITIKCQNEPQRSYRSQSAQYQAISSWFSKNKSGWHKSPASYVPEIQVTVGETSILLLKTLVVVNSNQKQLVKSVDTEGVVSAICKNT